MTLEAFDTAAAFQQDAGAWLEHDQRAHNLVLNVTRRVVRLGEPA